MAEELHKNYKPSECLRYMVVEIHPTLAKQWYAADIHTETTSVGVQLDIVADLFDPALILWSRLTPQKLANKDGQVQLTSPKQRCDHALYITTADDIEGYVHLHTLAEHIGGIKDIVGCKLTLVIFGTKEYFKPSTRKTKNSKQKLMTDVDLEMAITDLLVSTQCDAILVNTPNELALLIVQFTKAVAEQPYKLAKRNVEDQLNCYMQGYSKDCVALDWDGNGLCRLWQQMIAILPSSSLEVARTVCAEYKTPKDLHNAMSKSLDSINDLANLGVSRAAVPGAVTRRLGPEFARKLHKLFTETDGKAVME